MFRYLALIWNSRRREQRERAQQLTNRVQALSPQWRSVLQTEGMHVFCAHAPMGALRVHHLHCSRGVVLGALFHRTEHANEPSGDAPEQLSESTSKAIEATRGEHLISHYWGNYVAFLYNESSGVRRVIKDPCGGMPCFVTRNAGVAIVFSCIADCVRLGLKFTISAAYVREHVLSGGRNQTHTALTEVSPVYGGERLDFEHEPEAWPPARRLLWNPMRFVDEPDEFQDADRAARTLRATVRDCTHAWMSRHPSILHRLSGGLDSSIILGCLRDAPTRPQITAYTYFVPGSRADERPWARLAAEHAGCAHREIPFEPARVRLDALPRLQPTVEPTSVLAYVQRALAERELAVERSASAVFTGLGGDSGFCSDSKALALVEFLRRRGPRPSAIRLASHVALATQLSIWRVLFRSASIWILKPRMGDQRAAVHSASKLVSHAVRDSIVEQVRFPHPWFRNARGVPWAMIRRLGGLPYPAEFYDLSLAPEAVHPEVISPLYSQPAIELFLRIPLYVHFEGGIDRGLARRAFRHDVPAPILTREWKDRAPGYFEQVMNANLTFVRELLLDGILVQERLLDAKAVDEALSPSALQSSVHPGEILRHIDTELWLRRWRELRNEAPCSN